MAPMTIAEAALFLFAGCNFLRVLAYVPQIVRIAGDREGAKAISYATWILFTLSNLSTVAYALAAVQDAVMALVFAGNALSCFAVVVLTAWKRRQVKVAQARHGTDRRTGPKRAGLTMARS